VVGVGLGALLAETRLQCVHGSNAVAAWQVKGVKCVELVCYKLCYWLPWCGSLLFLSKMSWWRFVSWEGLCLLKLVRLPFVQPFLSRLVAGKCCTCYKHVAVVQPEVLGV